MTTTSEALAIALQHHRAGRLEAAEQIYQHILGADPNQVEVNYWLGVMAYQVGKHDLAVDYLARAITLRSDEGEFHHSLAKVLHASRRFPEAIAYYRSALALKPDLVEAQRNLGTVLKQNGELEQAVAAFRRALELDPGSFEVHNSLGNALMEQGNLDQAADSHRRALKLRPDYVEAHNNLGLALREQGNLVESVASFRRALEFKADYPAVHHNLGSALLRQARFAEAAESFRRAIELEPGLALAHNNLGLCLMNQGKLVEAIACHRFAVDLKPDFVDAHFNLGNILKVQGDVAESIACYRRVLELNSQHPAAHCNLGSALLRRGRITEAVESFRRAIELEPGLAQAHNNLGNALSAGGEPEAAIASYKTALRLQPDYSSARSNLLAVLQYGSDVTLVGLSEAHAEYDRLHAAPLRDPSLQHPNDRDPDRRLRLGFVSPHFAEHPVGRFIVRPLENIDRRGFEICCYSDTVVKDPTTIRIQGTADLWRDVFLMTDQELARQIGEDRIDLLFDLAGHTRGNRLGVFARKPAPVQITWLDYVGTTGLSAMDYLIADPREVPVEAEVWYRERVLRMPDDYICFDPPFNSPPVEPLPALARGCVTFGSFNVLAKVNPQTVAVWARILHRVTRSRLLLKNFGWDDAMICERYRRLFMEHEIAADRVEMRGWSPPAEVMNAYHEVDIALDTFPYNGGLTTCEALWMGVPVVTCAGETFASRHGLTHISVAGVTDTIAADLDEYVDLAVALAGDLSRLAALRAELRERMAVSPLCDGPKFGANLGGLVRHAWRSWIESSRHEA